MSRTRRLIDYPPIFGYSSIRPGEKSGLARIPQRRMGGPCAAPLVVGVTRDGKIYLGRDQVALDQLSQVIRDRLSYGAEQMVYLTVDRRTKYGVVINVLTEVRRAGVGNIAFFVEHPHPPPPI